VNIDTQYSLRQITLLLIFDVHWVKRKFSEYFSESNTVLYMARIAAHPVTATQIQRHMIHVSNQDWEEPIDLTKGHIPKGFFFN
jgi:hypothetical protein